MAETDKQVVIDHNTVFEASRPGVKTGLIFLAIIAAIVIGIYMPQIKATLGL
ncbi:MAG TPA: hypothetical protein VGO34_08695 [Alphaproteobacteria bacterium]|jgi:hypothetical protein